MKLKLRFRSTIIFLFIGLYLPSLLLMNYYFNVQNSKIAEKIGRVRLNETLSEIDLVTQKDSLLARKLINNYNENIAEIELNQHETKIYSAAFLSLIMIITIGIFSLIFYLISHPLKKLQMVTAKIGEGDFSIQLKEDGFQEIRALKGSFNSMSQELDKIQKKLIQAEKDAMWKGLSRILAHEIKNPLTPIQLSIQRLEEKYELDKEKFLQIFPETANIINQEIANLQNLAKTFSNFAKNIYPEKSIFNPSKMIKEIITSYEKNFQIKFQPCDCKIDFDRTHFYQIVTNILQNAIDASQKNDEIEIKIQKNEQVVKLSILDHGKGISKEDIKQIFEPYFTKKRKGTGLGLALVKKLVDINNAEIFVQSELNEFTKFMITIKRSKNESIDH